MRAFRFPRRSVSECARILRHIREAVAEIEHANSAEGQREAERLLKPQDPEAPQLPIPLGGAS